MLSNRKPVLLNFSPRDAAYAATRPAAAVENLGEKLKHIATLHPRGSDGAYTLATKSGGSYSESSYRAGDRLGIVELSGRHFVSMNRFFKRKMAKLLASVGHHWLEFDYYKNDRDGNPLPFAGMQPEAVMAILVAAIAEAGLPPASYWSFSGRGLHAVWVCEALPGTAASKINRIMSALYGPTLNEDGTVPARKYADADRDAQEARLGGMWKIFRDAGLDEQTKDSARLLRLWGSVNPESGLVCRRLWPEWAEDIQRCRVDVLADAVLPLTNAAFKARMAERVASRSGDVEPVEPRTRKAWTYSPKAGAWERKEADLLRYRQGLGRIPVGQRHMWLFLTANAAAQAHGRDIRLLAAELAPLAGLTVRDALGCLASLGRRQDRHLQGETREHDGNAWNPLFHHRGTTIANRLGITDEMADRLGMWAVRQTGTIGLTSTQRSAQKRIRDGAIPQPARAEAKAEAGRQGRAMRAEGRTQAETIATLRATFGRGLTWCKEAIGEVVDAAPVKTVTEVVPVASEDAFEAGRFSGRYIGGSRPMPPDRIEAEVAEAVSAPVVKAPAAKARVTEVSEPVLYDRPIITRLCATSFHYRTGPSSWFLVLWSDFHGSWSALTSDDTFIDVPEEFLAKRKQERSNRLEAFRTGARRSHGRVPNARRKVAVDPAQAAAEYRRASQGY
ncbi:hypothetical protein AFCDBAGC_4771 [Methylobacterium cerastii]|uniref:Uncharacterized protein n=1 Tax=Methylobacterium cerastii TaxID=932741 RepID=A0ABQ4QP89_9HYPH|nr:hypothetical protein [Methylobacterium cerastii]GJD46886.1 hypothetical protein AFCDBAGC_4771 [Methylobacterium cerastii]